MAWVLFIFLGAGDGILVVTDIATQADCRVLAETVPQYKTACFIDKNTRI